MNVSSALQMEAVLGAGAAALALLWLAGLAPWIARAAGAHLRQTLRKDIEATREASIEEMMPSVLCAATRRWVLWVLATIWAAAFAVLWFRVGVSSWVTAAYSALFAVLFVTSLIDLDTQLLPVPLVGAILWTGILAAMFNVVPLSLERAVLGVAAGWILFSLPGWILALARPGAHAAVGAGDISFIAACGAWLGPQQAVAAGCLAVIAALAVRIALGVLGSKHPSAQELCEPKEAETTYLPFGPLISLATIAMLCFDPFHFFLA